MGAEVGDRIEFGSAVEPCGGVVVSIKDGVAIIRWDAGGECIVTLRVLAALACGGAADPEVVIERGANALMERTTQCRSARRCVVAGPSRRSFSR